MKPSIASASRSQPSAPTVMPLASAALSNAMGLVRGLLRHSWSFSILVTPLVDALGDGTDYIQQPAEGESDEDDGEESHSLPIVAYRTMRYSARKSFR